jgi:hypothetical protein
VLVLADDHAGPGEQYEYMTTTVSRASATNGYLAPTNTIHRQCSRQDESETMTTFCLDSIGAICNGAQRSDIQDSGPGPVWSTSARRKDPNKGLWAITSTQDEGLASERRREGTHMRAQRVVACGQCASVAPTASETQWGTPLDVRRKPKLQCSASMGKGILNSCLETKSSIQPRRCL